MGRILIMGSEGGGRMSDVGCLRSDVGDAWLGRVPDGGVFANKQ